MRVKQQYKYRKQKRQKRTKETPLHRGRVYKDTLKRCRGCPYPRHGLACLSDDGTCLRTDMAAASRKRDDSWHG